MTRVDPRLEGAVRSEMRRLGGRSQRYTHRAQWPRAVAQSLHHGQHGLLEHVQRVAAAVPASFRPVAWLHHAGDDLPRARDLSAAGLTPPELEAISLLADAERNPDGASDAWAGQAIARAPGIAGRIARVVARAALADLLRTGAPTAGCSPTLMAPSELGLLR